MKTFKLADFVRILRYPMDNPNSEGHIVAVDNQRRTVFVSNMNMPFLGTFCWKEFSFDDVELKS